jgi:hypothetical protein
LVDEEVKSLLELLQDGGGGREGVGGVSLPVESALAIDTVEGAYFAVGRQEVDTERTSKSS